MFNLILQCFTSKGRHEASGDLRHCAKAFDGPYGKALAAYVVTKSATDWAARDVLDGDGGVEEVNVNNWGAVYDEMYKETDHSVSTNDPTLNWSGYTDTYSRRPHIEAVIKEWVEWSCEQVSNPVHQKLLTSDRQGRQGRHCITELGCGNGMLLFRLAPLLGSTGRYIGTDISSRALETVQQLQRTLPQYQHLNVETKSLAAHEILDVCKEKENDACLQYLLQHLLKHLLDLQFLQYLAFVCTELHSAWTCLRMVCDVSHFQQCFPRKWKLDCERVGAEDIVLCNGVTMYFPSANYLLKCSWNFKPNFFLFLGVLCFGFLCVRFVVKTWCS